MLHLEKVRIEPTGTNEQAHPEPMLSLVQDVAHIDQARQDCEDPIS